MRKFVIDGPSDVVVSVYRSCLWQTNATRIQLPGGTVLFDPCYYPEEIDHIAAEVDSANGERCLVFTHSDWDHIVGYSRFRGWRTFAHRLVAEKSAEQQRSILAEIAGFDGKWYVPRQPSAAYPHIASPIGADAEPGATSAVSLAGESAVVLHTPGHTDDGIATFFPRLRLVVAGDLLSDLEFPFIYHSASAYRRSLDRMAAVIDELKVEKLIPGHGPAALSRAEIDARLRADTDYLDRLTDAVARAAETGVRGDELVAHLSGFPYRGAPVNRHIADFHEGNIRLIEREFLSRAGA